MAFKLIAPRRSPPADGKLRRFGGSAQTALANGRYIREYLRMPDRQLPLLETAGFDLMAQVEAMLRQVSLYQREVRRIRELLGEGHRDVASQLLTDGAVVNQMKQLRLDALTLVDTIDTIESWVAEERASRR